HAGLDSDIEIQRLMVKALQAIGIESIHIDFSHVGIFRSLVKREMLTEGLEQRLYAALQSKDQSGVRSLSAELDAGLCDALCSLTELNGDVNVLDEAAKRLPASPEITQALQELRRVSESMADLGVATSFDLAELRGYHYHSGMVFAAYAKGYSGALALGGRYDEVGSAFGRARPATG